MLAGKTCFDEVPMIFGFAYPDICGTRGFLASDRGGTLIHHSIDLTVGQELH